MGHYGTSLEQILAELERLELLLRVQVWRGRQRPGDTEAELGPFYITEAEVDAIFETAIGTPRWTAVPLPAQMRETIQSRLDELSAEIQRRTAASLDAACRCGWSSWPACST